MKYSGKIFRQALVLLSPGLIVAGHNRCGEIDDSGDDDSA